MNRSRTKTGGAGLPSRSSARMQLSDLGEFGLIERIRRTAVKRRAGTLVGIGDDAAVLRTSPPAVLLATTDLLLEGVHFDLSFTDHYSLGWKAAAVNVSDIAAMGGAPRFCLTGLGIPPSTPAAAVLDFYRGLNDLLRHFGTALVGGDTCSSRQGMFVSVTVLGEAGRNRVITRSGARPGDRIFVTRTLGDAAAGLELLRNGWRDKGRGTRRSGDRNAAAALLERHLRPRPRVREGMAIAATGCASAMIDVSDGLSSDLYHICEQSGVGAEISEAAVPYSAPLRAVAQALSRPLLTYALDGGEDYELLFTVPVRRVARLQALGLPVSEIGVVTRKQGVVRVGEDGRKRVCAKKGFDHFPPRPGRAMHRQ